MRFKLDVPLKWQTICLSVLCVVLAIILIALVMGTAYINSILNRLSIDGNTEPHYTIDPTDVTDDDYDPNFTDPTVDPTDVTVSTVNKDEHVILQRDDIINIMLIGQDRKPGEGRQRSDSMILCSFNTTTGNMTMVSFLRDTYVHIPGFRDNKLNAAFQYGGTPTLDDAIATNFGIHVDANVAVDFEGFMGLIDLLGGVTINLTEKEVEHLNKLHGWSLTPGVRRLNGEEALAYSRIRKIDMDAMRAQRQRNVITALIKSFKSQSIYSMIEIAEEILNQRLVSTDMSSDQIISYIWQLFPMLSSATICSQQIPANGTYEEANIGDVKDAKLTDLEANREILKNVLGY